jgi:hypothetical protein
VHVDSHSDCDAEKRSDSVPGPFDAVLQQPRGDSSVYVITSGDVVVVGVVAGVVVGVGVGVVVGVGVGVAVEVSCASTCPTVTVGTGVH